MFIENGYIETLDIEEAKLHGNYVVIEEEIEEEIIENNEQIIEE